MKQLGVTLLVATSIFGAQNPASVATIDRDAKEVLSNKVRHAINGLPYYGVFDDLSYSINENGVVTLSGAARTYVVRNSAINAVKNLSGVTGVEDKIEVLPLSPYDDSIRVRAYNAIFGYPALSRYAINSRPPVRIIVDRGNLTLEGVVNNELDRTLIENRIRSVAGVFSVKNNLRLDSEPEQSGS